MQVGAVQVQRRGLVTVLKTIIVARNVQLGV